MNQPIKFNKKTLKKTFGTSVINSPMSSPYLGSGVVLWNFTRDINPTFKFFYFFQLGPHLESHFIPTDVTTTSGHSCPTRSRTGLYNKMAGNWPNQLITRLPRPQLCCQWKLLHKFPRLPNIQGKTFYSII